MIAQTKQLVKIVLNFLKKTVKLGRLRHRFSCDVVVLMMVVTVCALYYWMREVTINLELSKRYVEDKLVESLKMDKGTGCVIPELDPFSKEMTQYDKVLPPIDCRRNGRDWVRCYQSKCRVVDEIKQTVKDISCELSDILYESDKEYTLGTKTFMTGDGVFRLQKSDHVKVSCTGTNIEDGYTVQWVGNTMGLRPVQQKEPPPGRERSYNVLIFGFDSAAKNGFIRQMPLSWKVLTEELGATVMHGFNVLGDGTPPTLFPLLTGKSEFELPDVRKRTNTNETMDSFPFIFYNLKEDGYRTAYFEDMPQIGTFQYRFNGWRHQPADHYLRAFFLEDMEHRSWFQYLLGGPNYIDYCVGDTPQYKLMINITEQFMELRGKWFAFTFIGDITHDEFNMIQFADNDTAEFLRSFKKYAEDTLLVVMGDHGPRFSANRETLQGKLEERLPLLALLLPSSLTRARPAAAAALRANARALSTPHDLHATLLDVLGMTRHWNPHRTEGADLPRALSMLQPIPSNRSCSEAGIEPHWCVCVAWQNVSTFDPLYERSAQALLQYINELSAEVGSLCAQRTLTSIDWVMRQRHKKEVLKFARSVDSDELTANTRAKKQSIQIKFTSKQGGDFKSFKEKLFVQIVVGPGRSVFEASMMYVVKQGVFLVDRRDISRVNRYNEEPHCISNTHPHLNPFCYCRKK